MKNLFLFAGEASGDLYGSALMHELPKEYTLSGVGGPLMRKEGLDTFLPMEEFQVHGIGQILSDLPKIIRQFYQIRDHILEKNPDGVVFIDYPGLNIRMAKALRKKGYKGKLIHYISPSVWAWGKNRVYKMEKSLDLLLTIFPFEAKYYAETKLPVKFVGHPLISQLKEHRYNETWSPFKRKILALFPGSRTSEIKRNLPKMLEAAKQCDQYDIALSIAQEKQRPLIESIVEKSDCKVTLIPPKHRYELMRDCTLAIAALGTIHLELALHETPTIGVYDLSPLNLFYAHFILRVRLPFYSIANFISGHELYPEFVKRPFTPKEVLQTIKTFDLEKCKQGCRELKELFGNENANQRAAKSIQELIL